MQINHIVFYGTLKQNHRTPLHNTIDRYLEYIGPCTLAGNLYNCGRYPGLKPGKGEVRAELYKINNNKALKPLDEFEASDNDDPKLPGFSRKQVNLINPQIEAWVYFYDGKVSKDQLIDKGVWN